VQACDGVRVRALGRPQPTPRLRLCMLYKCILTPAGASRTIKRFPWCILVMSPSAPWCILCVAPPWRIAIILSCHPPVLLVGMPGEHKPLMIAGGWPVEPEKGLTCPRGWWYGAGKMKGIGIHDHRLKVGVEICTYSGRAKMASAVGGFKAQHGGRDGFVGVGAASRVRWLARCMSCWCSRGGESGWFHSRIFLDSRNHGAHAEHELFHAAIAVGAAMRSSRRVRAPVGLGVRERDLWWDEYAARLFSDLLAIWRLWYKYWYDAYRIPRRQLPGGVFH